MACAVLSTGRLVWAVAILSITIGAGAAHGQYVGVPFAVSDDTAQVLPEDQPAAVFADGQFLVVHTQWVANAAQEVVGDIYGAFVDPLADTIERFPIDTYDSSSSHPALAYDPDNGRFLLAYEDRRDGYSDSDLYIRLLDAAGETLAEQFIASTYNHELMPAVAYIGAGQFQVVWCDTTNEALPVDAVVIGRTVGYDAPDLVLGTEYLLNAGTTFVGLTQPKIAADKFGRCLVVWQWPSSTAGLSMDDWVHNTQGRVLDNSGQPIGSITTVAGTANDERAPDLAYDPYDDIFFVAWQDKVAAGNHNILGTVAIVDAGGAISLMAPSEIATANLDDTRPAVGWNSGLHQFLVTWEAEYTANDHDVHACLVTNMGVVGTVFPVVESLDMESRPAMARGNGQFLVVYEDEWTGVMPTEVYGALLDDVSPPPHVTGVYPPLAACQSMDDNMRQILVEFDQAVQIAASDVTVQGLIAGPRNDFTLSYDPETRIAALTWNEPLPDDTYLVTIADTVLNNAALALDGDMDLLLPVLPSGNGLEGGNFQGLIYRLVADSNGDLSVDVVDLLTLASAFGRMRDDPGYDAAVDFNSDGSIDVVDLLTLAAHWGNAIPAQP